VATIKDIVEFCESQRMQAFCDAALKIIRRHDSDFSESDHPRDNEGKFSESGSGSSSLTAEEKSHVTAYAGDDYDEINKAARSGKIDTPAIKNLDTAIAKSKISKGSTLFRGVSKRSSVKLFGEEIKEGMTISDPAFASTSGYQGLAERHALGGGVLLKIDVGGNAKGLDIDEYSPNVAESEVLLPRNAKMTVKKIEKPKSPYDPIIVTVSYGD
jgi:hypothetical protein